MPHENEDRGSTSVRLFSAGDWLKTAESTPDRVFADHKLPTGAQWALQRGALVSVAGASTSVLFAGSLLVVAGVFQWTPWKKACLGHCRSPLLVLMTSWRDGPPGALAMGLEHGAFCVGCCWAFMALMFVAGVMNILWLAAIALFVLVEEILPAGDRNGRLAGAGMVRWGFYVIGLGPCTVKEPGREPR